jgi:hypothetical protein
VWKWLFCVDLHVGYHFLLSFSKFYLVLRCVCRSADYHCFFVNIEFFYCVHIMTSFSEVENLRCFTFSQRVAVI